MKYKLLLIVLFTSFILVISIPTVQLSNPPHLASGKQQVLLRTCNTLSPSTSNNTIYYFYLIGSSTCPHCGAMKDFLIKTYGEDHFYFCDAYTNLTCYEKITEIYQLFKDEAFGAVPQVYVVYNCTLSAIIIGEARNKEFLDSLLKPNYSDKVPVYYGTGSWGEHYADISMSPVEQLRFIRKYLNYKNYCINYTLPSRVPTNTLNSSRPKLVKNYDLINVLPQLVILALIDSVNPCTMTLYFTFILTLLSAKKRILGPAILFIIVVYFGYYMIGVGFRLLASYIPPKILLILALLVGFYNVVDAARKHGEGFKCEVCNKFSVIDRALRNPYLTAVILSGIAVTILLPCTSGPLLVFVSIIRNYPLILSMILLILYTLIFSFPLILIFLIGFIAGKKEKIANYLTEHAAVVEFLAGILIILFAFIMLLS